jgi:hypothetical protein
MIMSEKWLSAAKRYLDHRPDAQKRARDARIRSAAQELVGFLGSNECEEAKQLLCASRESVVIGVQGAGSCKHTFFFGYGVSDVSFWERIEGGVGIETRGADPCDIIEAAIAAHPDELADPERDIPYIVPWLRKRLDKIADAAPKSKEEEREASS